MKLVGDVHGKYRRLRELLRSTEQTVLCVGDVAIGFPGIGPRPYFRKNFRFAFGNHDKREACLLHPQFTVEYGMWNGIFIIGGARSIDQIVFNNRTEGVDWWRDEELSYAECMRAVEMYAEAKPDIVVSHDAPFFLHPHLKAAALAKDPRVAVFGEPRPYNAVLAMEKMFEIHQPKFWGFGHWHVSYQARIGNTDFRCLDELEMIDLPYYEGTGNG